MSVPEQTALPIMATRGKGRVDVRTRRPYDRYIGRANARYGLAASPYANPFVIGRDGDRYGVVGKFEHWARTSDDPRAAYIREHVHELHAETLGCWCGQGELCHGDVLHAMAAEAVIRRGR